MSKFTTEKDKKKKENSKTQSYVWQDKMGGFKLIFSTHTGRWLDPYSSDSSDC